MSVKVITCEPNKRCPKKEDIKARAFWTILDPAGFTFPNVPAGGVRPLGIPNLRLIQSKDFKQVQFTVNSRTVTALQYVGNKPANFLVNISGNISAGVITTVMISTQLAVGRGGGVPNQPLPGIRSTNNVLLGQIETISATGIVTLFPCDTVGILFSNNGQLVNFRVLDLGLTFVEI
jgi:hypothetical protein